MKRPASLAVTCTAIVLLAGCGSGPSSAPATNPPGKKAAPPPTTATPTEQPAPVAASKKRGPLPPPKDPSTLTSEQVAAENARIQREIDAETKRVNAVNDEAWKRRTDAEEQARKALMRVLEGLCNKLKKACLNEGTGAFKHEETIENILFKLPDPENQDMGNLRVAFTRPSTQAVVDEIQKELDGFRKTVAGIDGPYQKVKASLETELRESVAELEQQRPDAPVKRRLDELSKLAAKPLDDADALLSAGMRSGWDESDPERETKAAAIAKPLAEAKGKLGEFATWAKTFPEQVAAANKTASAIDEKLKELSVVSIRVRSVRLIAELKPHLDDAARLLAGGGEAKPVTNRQQLSDFLTALEAADKERRAGADACRTRLMECKTKLAEFAAAAKKMPLYVSVAEGNTKLINERLAELDTLKATNNTPAFTYHKALVETLPATLDSVDALAKCAKMLKQARTSEPEKWSLKLLADAYSGWLGSACMALVGDAEKLRACPAEDVDRLILFLSKAEEDGLKVPDAAKLLAKLEDAKGEREIAALPAGCLAPMNAWAATRPLGLKPEVRWHHVELLNRLNQNKDLAAVTGIRQAVESDMAASPANWQDKAAMRLYASQQRNQLLAYARKNFNEEWRAAYQTAAQRHEGRNRSPQAMKEWAESVKGLRLQEATEIRELLSGGALDAKALDECAAENKLPLSTRDLPFWEDATFMLEAIAAKTESSPFLTNPYVLTRTWGLPDEARRYHVSLIRKLTPTDVGGLAVMKGVVQKEVQAHPEFWRLQNGTQLAPVYAELQLRWLKTHLNIVLGQRFTRVVEAYEKLHRGKDLDGKRYVAETVPGTKRAWAEAARALKPEELRGVQTLLEAGFIANDPRPWLQENFGISLAAELFGQDTGFWQDCLDTLGAGNR